MLRGLTCCLVLSLAASAAASTILEELTGYAPCLRAPSPWPCIKEKALALFDKVLLTDRVEMAHGLVVERNPEERSLHFDASDELNMPEETSARERRLDELLLKRVVTFFQTRSVTFNPEQFTDGRLFKKKIKKFVIPLLLIKLGLSLMATKALVIGKIALALTIFVMIRDFIDERKQAQHETFEVYAKHPSDDDYHRFDASSPIQATVSGFYPSNKGRLFQDAHDAAYHAHRPTTSS
ncbi:Hypothetical predicted protein [Cloeon dipterum]|uniref:Osiris 9 n=2 Tax=Cloeon dipterum TaxID=197152 RepID=A0A8S1C0F5_9INSE|nr:Hypothetical predicted protein [Cloeon dipterum]